MCLAPAEQCVHTQPGSLGHRSRHLMTITQMRPPRPPPGTTSPAMRRHTVGGIYLGARRRGLRITCSSLWPFILLLFCGRPQSAFPCLRQPFSHWHQCIVALLPTCALAACSCARLRSLQSSSLCCASARTPSLLAARPSSVAGAPQAPQAASTSMPAPRCASQQTGTMQTLSRAQSGQARSGSWPPPGCSPLQHLRRPNPPPSQAPSHLQSNGGSSAHHRTPVKPGSSPDLCHRLCRHLFPVPTGLL